MKKLTKNYFTTSIIQWYKKKGRDFPWRYNKDIYQVLVSELLLQKTDAPKVEAVFNDFFSAYKEIHDIYKAEIKDIEEKLLHLGLYKHRADRLKSIAQTIVENYSGEIPQNKEDLLKLKGVGEYISNAVLCFGYNEPEPIVDTNVIRIFNRLFKMQSSKKRPRNDKDIWKFAGELLPKKKIQDYNYGLLDFASLICKSKKPVCHSCMFLNYCSYGKKFLSK
jgi:A/G-specific adenine glycosylase